MGHVARHVFFLQRYDADSKAFLEKETFVESKGEITASRLGPGLMTPQTLLLLQARKGPLRIHNSK